MNKEVVRSLSQFLNPLNAQTSFLSTQIVACLSDNQLKLVTTRYMLKAAENPSELIKFAETVCQMRHFDRDNLTPFWTEKVHVYIVSISYTCFKHFVQFVLSLQSCFRTIFDQGVKVHINMKQWDLKHFVFIQSEFQFAYKSRILHALSFNINFYEMSLRNVMKQAVGK